MRWAFWPVVFGYLAPAWGLGNINMWAVNETYQGSTVTCSPTAVSFRYAVKKSRRATARPGSGRFMREIIGEDEGFWPPTGTWA